jgi:tyrosyl-tRNA synthetase
MSLPDHLIVSYLEVYTDVSLEFVSETATQVEKEPMKWKLFLAHEIVRRYHSAEIADNEQEWFLRTFSTRKTPGDIPVMQVEPRMKHKEVDIMMFCVTTCYTLM